MPDPVAKVVRKKRTPAADQNAIRNPALAPPPR